MIVRIVKMTFRQDAIEEFTSMFEERRMRIRNFEGCTHLELWQDNAEPTVFFTYSTWQSQQALDHYRFSEFFKDTWGRTKSLFAGPPQAWSVTRKYVMD
ncbi:MAG: antibiotic biosynthesis monooxygenase [Taibaiella sp.]|nr:antibiotic biosynthesis monooxygenase [Taibaiella sp.]